MNLQALGVLATFAATLVALLIALFGEHWRAKLHPPKLRVALDLPLGKRFSVESVPCRWFCVRVRNENRTRNATDVRLLLLKVDVFNNDPMFPDWTWTGDLPMLRSHPEVYPLPPVIGPTALFDVFTVYKEHRVELHPILTPTDLRKDWGTPTHLKLTMQARSNEVDSPIVTVRIKWDGVWSEDDKEMAKHLHVEEKALHHLSDRE